MRLFNKRLRKLLPAAGGRQRLGALLFSAMLVGSDVSAGAAENYRGRDSYSSECSSGFKISTDFLAAERSGGAALVELERSALTMAEQREKLTGKYIIEVVIGASLAAIMRRR